MGDGLADFIAEVPGLPAEEGSTPSASPPLRGRRARQRGGVQVLDLSTRSVNLQPFGVRW